MRCIIFTVLLFSALFTQAQSEGDYRSKQSGNWSDAGSWQRYNGTAFVDAPGAPSNSSGVITVRNGHTITINNEIAADQLIVENGSTLNNNGSILLYDGPGADIIVNGILNGNNINGDALKQNPTVEVNGEMNWTGGRLTAELTNYGTINMSNGVSFQYKMLRNYGTFNWNSGQLHFYGSGISNYAGGIFIDNVTNDDNNYFYWDDNGGSYFNNQGTFIKNGTGAFKMVGIGFNNTGTLKGIGTIAAYAAFTNTGTIEPGTSPGILQFTGAQLLSPTSTLLLEIKDGSGPGIGHDQLIRNDNLTLDGTLKIVKTGNVPVGQYTIIEVSSGNISGSFSTLDLPEGCSIITTPTSIVLKVEDVDSDKDGVFDSQDCAPNDNTKWRTGTFYKDADGDTYTTGGAVTICYGATTPAGYTATQKGTDCDDADPAKWRTGTFYKDADADTYTTGSAVTICYGAATPVGYVITQKGTDCDDNDATKWRTGTFYKDTDGDTYTTGNAVTICYGANTPTGYVATQKGTDCNDNNAAIHPGASEICGNGIDEDCDGKDGICAPTDSDGDGVPDNTDCAPNDKTKWQSAMLYIDADNDGYDNGQITVCYGATIPSGYKSSTLGKDCNDGNASIHPGATDICGNGIDEDCDGKDAVCVPVNVYYSKPSGNLHAVLSWGVNPDGSGEIPADFGEGKTFNLANRSGVYTMTGNWTVAGTLVNPSGSQLKINGYTLSLTTLTGTGTLTGSMTSSLVIAGTGGGNFGNINFTSGGGMLKSFTLNRSGSGGAATIGTWLSVYDVLTITSGTLNTGAKLTLKSTATGTARVAPVTGSISGNVVIERYIPARRAWRLMNSPVGGTQTVNQAWQEGATTASANPNPAPGYGTYVTVGSVANGFDQNILGQSISSLKSFTAAGALQVVSSTHTAKVANKPYMLFVRGDRSITMRDNTVPANNTTLRATGPLLTGNQTIPVAASGFTAVANPFASPINFGSITRTNVTNSFYVWDPKMGGNSGVGAYVNISYNGTGYDITPASTSPESQYIQSGQSFLVQSTGAAGSLVIKESDKSATAAQNVFRQSGGSDQQSAIGDGLVFAPARNAIGLRVNLQIADGSERGVLDEVFASYSSNFSDEIDNMDALKADNVMENLSIIRKGQALMVDRRKLIQTSDTLQLNLSNTTASTYMFEFSPIELSGAESVTLADHYLKTNTDVSLSEISQVYFHITSDSRSSAADRFSVIIVNRKGVPGLDITGKASIRAYPNPVTSNGNINLQFDHIKAGMYRFELVNAAGQTVYRSIMYLQNGIYHQRLNIGQNLPSGVYQMKITGKDSQRVLKIMRR